MSTQTKCPKCGHKLAGKPKPLPNPKAERLKEKLYFLSSELSYLTFENGRAFQQEQEHRLALLAILRTNKKLERAQKRLRLKIAAVEKQLSGESGGKVLG